MSRKTKPHYDYIWFQVSEHNENVYVHLTYENNRYVRYFYDDSLPESLVKREEINSPRSWRSMCQIMQSTFFEFWIYSNQ